MRCWAFELNHYIHRKTQGADGVTSLKIDISKAYDRLEWRYVELMLRKMGFPQYWIAGVMQLVTTVSYIFVRDGKVFGEVHPTRGIRQGDPISPYLYIVCAEGLTGYYVTKLQSWSNKELSKAGKLTLVGIAAQTTPNFWMSLFLILDAICYEIERKMNAFLWGNATGRGVKWITWKKLCVSKEFGGLGLKELKKFNTAMLAKQGWRLLLEANPLVSTVMKAKYYPQADILNADLGNNPSYVCRGIVAALEVLKSGARRRIGNGENTLVWRDPWLPDVSNGYI
ncbi:putative mitochondrial protein AtMg00310 [Apium graveolens]|uniref:putative mitochondrial protein AtMg00310 n=1 Tax=Apium graveolens TaxID=4045 RepID=UPI003D79FEB2